MKDAQKIRTKTVLLSFRYLGPQTVDRDELDGLKLELGRESATGSGLSLGHR